MLIASSLYRITVLNISGINIGDYEVLFIFTFIKNLGGIVWLLLPLNVSQLFARVLPQVCR